MNDKKRILWITRTAIFIALLIVAHTLSKLLGQIVTGSMVNLILALSVLLGGLESGLAAAGLSPWLAFLLGIGPQFPAVIPFIMLGNLAWVTVWHLIAGRADSITPMRALLAPAVGAIAKFAVLYPGIVMLAVPIFLSLPEPQAAAVSSMFSYPQLITAGIGGAIAAAAAQPLRKALAIR